MRTRNNSQAVAADLRVRISRSEATRASVAGVSRAKGVDKKAIGERIRARREGLGIAQVDLADRIDVRPPTMWRYENGDTLPGPVAIQRLSEELQVSASWILHGTDDTHIERDDALGYPIVEQYIADMERAGTPVDARHAQKLRMQRLSTGPSGVDMVTVRAWHLAAQHEDHLRAVAPRPEDSRAQIDEARGQRKLPPVKRRR